MFVCFQFSFQFICNFFLFYTIIKQLFYTIIMQILCQLQAHLMKQHNRIKLSEVIIQNTRMMTLRLMCLIVLSLVLSYNCAEISIGQNEAGIVEKRKAYCMMISYHFLDNDMEVFNSVTSGMSSLRIEVFRHKVANRLAQKCQQKITIQQLTQLSKLVQNPTGRQQEIEEIQNKYIQFFAPQEDTVLRIVQKVKVESDLQVEKQVHKYHQKRRQIEESARVVLEGLKSMQHHINKTNHHINNLMNTLYESFSLLQGNITQGLNKLKNHPEVKKLQQFWDQL